MANPKLEWLHTVLDVNLEVADEGSATPSSPAGEDGLASLWQDLDLPTGLGESTVYADVTKTTAGPAGGPDPKDVEKLLKALDAVKPDLAKFAGTFPVTPALKKLAGDVVSAVKDLKGKFDANDAKGGLASMEALKKVLKAYLDAAAAQDKTAMPKATAAQTKVADLVSKNKLAAMTNAEKIALLHDLQGPATQVPEVRKAQRDIYKTIELDPKFVAEDTKKREQVVKTLIATPKDKEDFKKKRDDWAHQTPAEKVALLKKALEAHCKVLGIPVPPIETFDEPAKVVTRPDGTTVTGVLNGAFNPDDGKLHLNVNAASAIGDFEQALDLVFHENSHHYQIELVKKLESGKLTKKDPEYEQALLFQANSQPSGYVKPEEDVDVYPQQPLEKQAWDNGPKTAKAVLDALN